MSNSKVQVPAARDPVSGYNPAVGSVLHDEAEDLAKILIRRAKAGDAAATRLCLERIAPQRRERPVGLTLPPIKSIGDAREAAAHVVEAAAAGTVTPREATEFLRVIEGFARVLRVADQLERRTEQQPVHQTVFRWLYPWDGETVGQYAIPRTGAACWSRRCPTARPR